MSPWLGGHEKDRVVYYIYADAATCQCFFWGRDQSYQNFLQLQDQLNIANEERMTAEMNEQEYLDWDTIYILNNIDNFQLLVAKTTNSKHQIFRDIGHIVLDTDISDSDLRAHIYKVIQKLVHLL